LEIRETANITRLDMPHARKRNTVSPVPRQVVPIDWQHENVDPFSTFPMRACLLAAGAPALTPARLKPQKNGNDRTKNTPHRMYNAV